jgi:hypothetical protein
MNLSYLDNELGGPVAVNALNDERKESYTPSNKLTYETC